VLAGLMLSSTSAHADTGSVAGADVPARGLDMSALKDVERSQSPSTTENSVESFFQIHNPKSKSSANYALASPAAAPPVTSDRTDGNKSKSTLGGVGRFFWHVLDNAGVPMVFAKHNDLDPDIDTSNNGSSPIVVSTKLRLLDKLSDSQSMPENPLQTSNGANPHKIPQSELEGVELPTLRDEQTLNR